MEKVEKQAQGILDKNKREGIPDKRVDSQTVVDIVGELQNEIVYYQVSTDRTGVKQS